MNFILLFGRLFLLPPQGGWEHVDPGAGVVGGAAGVPGTGAAGLARVPLRGAGAAPSRSGGLSAVPQHLLWRAREKRLRYLRGVILSLLPARRMVTPCVQPAAAGGPSPAPAPCRRPW